MKYASIYAIIDKLQNQLFKGNKITNSGKILGKQLRWSTILVKLQAFIRNFIKTGPNNGCSRENFKIFRITISI